MKVEFIHVNHSIPDAVGFAIHSPAGVIVHTGDFKIDSTPAQGEMIDLARFAELGKKGVLALMADSTNAERPGYTKTEKMVDNSFESLFQRAENNRIIIATFASNISRVQQIINCAVRFGRKVALSGRSMLNVMGIAVELGYLDVPEGVLIDIDLLNRYPKEKVVLVTTGSQGEPMSALARMAFADHRKVEVGPGDFIIISARPIPGNEKTVGNVVDELLKRGCEVVYESMYEVHVSGHACQDELKIIHGIVKPKYFIPVHGEQKMLQKHAGVAKAMGMSSANIYIGDIGDVVEINEAFLRNAGTVPAWPGAGRRPGGRRRGQHSAAGPQAPGRGRPHRCSLHHLPGYGRAGCRPGCGFKGLCLCAGVRAASGRDQGPGSGYYQRMRPGEYP